MSFVKFPSIEGFPNVWHSMNRLFDPKPTLYGAKIKLHGTNAGIRVNADGSVVAQSRSRDLSLNDDNYGFAAWVAENEREFSMDPRVMKGFGGAVDIEHFTYFGEWAGRGIQDKDAVTRLAGKYFFVFAVQINDRMYTDPEWIESICPDLDHLVVLPWHHVFETPVNWTDAEPANAMIEKINEMVEEIAVRDPFIYDLFDIDAPGEGLVMAPVEIGTLDGFPRDHYAAQVFKAKTEAHRVKKSSKSVTAIAELPEGVREFVAMFVTDARCAQGLAEACGGVADRRNTGAFLKWLSTDVFKESALELEQTGLEWKTVVPLVNKAASNWYLKRCEAA